MTRTAGPPPGPDDQGPDDQGTHDRDPHEQAPHDDGPGRGPAVPPGHGPDGVPPAGPREERPRRRAWPWVVGTLALVAVLAGVGVGVFTLLDRSFGPGPGSDEVVYAEDGSPVVEDELAEGDGYGDNPDLDALWDACEGGDGNACDELYITSALGSAYETYGYTCGERLGEADERPATCEEVVAG